MNTPITFIYKKVSETLSSGDFDEKLQPLELEKPKHFDLYEKQPYRESTEIAYNLPAVFQEIYLTGSEQSAGMRVENYALKLYIEQKQLGSTAQNSHNKEETLKKLLLTEVIKNYLLQNNTTLILKKLYLDQRGKNNPVHVIEFEFSINIRNNC